MICQLLEGIRGSQIAKIVKIVLKPLTTPRRDASKMFRDQLMDRRFQTFVVSLAEIVQSQHNDHDYF